MIRLKIVIQLIIYFLVFVRYFSCCGFELTFDSHMTNNIYLKYTFELINKMTINCFLLHKYWYPDWKPSPPFQNQSYNVYVHDLIKYGFENYMTKCNQNHEDYPLISPTKKSSDMTRDNRKNLDHTQLCTKINYSLHASTYPKLFRKPTSKTPTKVKFNCLECKKNRNKFNKFCKLQGWSRNSVNFKEYHKTEFKKLISKNRVQIGKYMCKCKLCTFNGLSSVFCSMDCWKRHNHHSHI